MTDNLDNIADRIRSSFTDKDAAREKVLPLCREVIRFASQSIRAIHRHEYDNAAELIGNGRSLLDDIRKAAGQYTEFLSSGYVRDAQKEFAEANTCLALITGKHVPDPDELGVDYAAYLNGLGEAAGEIRRFMLDSLRCGDLSRGEELLCAMDDIYSILVTMDFPEAVTGGLRHTTDMVRGVLERTRSDLTLAIRQKILEEKIESIISGKESKEER